MFQSLMLFTVITSVIMTLCVHFCLFLFCVIVSALINSSDATMQFLLHNPIDALLAVEVSHKEYLLVFTSKCRDDSLHSLTIRCCTVFYDSLLW